MPKIDSVIPDEYIETYAKQAKTWPDEAGIAKCRSLLVGDRSPDFYLGMLHAMNAISMMFKGTTAGEVASTFVVCLAERVSDT